ncbi:spermidine synthase [Caldalkalibacillus uzonensis]|uniref:Polyamine aminopropyltransferase n=1 Tax=Caldalkalibacillus uzonensis TaxID=353224 RepID=A0ABU0CVT4_9BACI|nr:polyamine aminopropyltransferase [Caldalkalibacillus uzonensis]MDQ0340439.1 spermidine synthase [Caldalkalibacillus uzonensis]
MITQLEWLKEIDGHLWLVEDERENMKLSYRVKEVIHAEQSPFQHVMIVDTYDFGPTLVLDGVVQTTSRDGHIYNEMITHIPLLTHPHPKRVLIIGGGDCGAAREVCKYPQVEQIDMVEIDELVVKVSKQYLTDVSGNLSDPRVNFIYEDGTSFIKNRQETYDVVIVDSSDPIGPAEQLFSYEFYRDVHRALQTDGVMVCQSQSPIFHMNILKQTYERIGQLFPVVHVYQAVVPTYPGGLWSFTLGSKTYRPEQLDAKWDKQAKYVNQGILQGCFQLPESVRQALEK